MSTNKPTEYSVQKLENWSMDASVEPHILRRGLLGKASDGKYYDISVQPDGSIGANASLSITEATVGTVTTTTIVKTIGSTSYTKSIAEDSSDNSVTVSVWSEV